MRTIVSPQRALTAALIAAALAALGCSDGGALTAPTQSARAASSRSVQSATLPSLIGVRGPSHSGYALASGRIADSLGAPAGK